MSFFVYLLECTDNSTYVGATVDLTHRLRQHNMEIKGGAHATSMKVKNGLCWERVCHVRGFPDWKSALQFEWAFKYYSRKLPQKMFPLERRIRALKQILNMDRPTSKSIPYKEWIDISGSQLSPEIVWEKDGLELLYERI